VDRIYCNRMVFNFKNPNDETTCNVQYTHLLAARRSSLQRGAEAGRKEESCTVYYVLKLVFLRPLEVGRNCFEEINAPCKSYI
jgi:hypothetical protein